MFPAPSPNSQALFAQLASGGATPSTIDFHRTAMSAAAAKRDQAPPPAQPSVTSQPQDVPNGVAPVKTEPKAPTGPFDNHDNDAANGLFMLAQGRNGAQPQPPFPVAPQPQVHGHPVQMPQQAANTSPQMTNGNGSINGGSMRGVSEAGSAMSDESEQARPNTRGKGKRNSGAGAATTNGRRKAEEAPAKGPANKKVKTNGGAPSVNSMDDEDDHSDDDKDNNNPKQKMTDEEKRKNFLERNR